MNVTDTVGWCYLCQMGDPHDHHITDVEFFGPTLIAAVRDLRERREPMTYDSLDNTRASLRRTILDAEERLAALEAIPNGDTYENGTIVRATLRHRRSGNLQTYVFLKVVVPAHYTGDPTVHWYHTGHINHGISQRTDHQWFDGWDALAKWLGNGERVIESWEVIWPTPVKSLQDLATTQVKDEDMRVRVSVIDDTPEGSYWATLQEDGSYRL